MTIVDCFCNTVLFQIELKGPKAYQIGFDILTISAKDTGSPHYFAKKSSGVYRPGYVITTLDIVPGTKELYTELG